MELDRLLSYNKLRQLCKKFNIIPVGTKADIMKEIEFTAFWNNVEPPIKSSDQIGDTAITQQIAESCEKQLIKDWSIKALKVYYLALSPKLILNIGEKQVMLLCDYYKIPSQTQEVSEKRQRLMEYFYQCEDSKSYVFMSCHSTSKQCNEIADFTCVNYLCRKCCNEEHNKIACPVHDLPVHYFRYLIRDVMLFEENLDSNLVLKCCFESKVTKLDVVSIFTNYGVSQTSLTCKFHPFTSVMQYIYVKFENTFQWQRAYENRKIFKAKGCQVKKLYQNINNLQKPSKANSMIVVFPPQNMYKCAFPSKSNRIGALKKLFGMMLSQPISTTIIEDIGGMYYVTFENIEQLRIAFNSQPYFGSAVAHKALHISPFIYMKNDFEQCLACTGRRSGKCLVDLCDDCCKIQINPRCTHSVSYNESREFCKMCTNKSNICINKLCKNCCEMQLEYKQCYSHNLVTLIQQLNQIDSIDSISAYLDAQRAKVLLKLFSMAKEGLLLPSVTDKLITSVESFGHPIKKELNGSLMKSGLNSRGEPYIDYIYNNEYDAISNDNEFERVDNEEEKEAESKTKHSFHLMLSNISLSIPPHKLISTIYDDLNKKGCKVSSNCIKLIDPQSALNLASNLDCNCKSFINGCGNICCIYFNDISHALPILTREIELSIPRQAENMELGIIPSQILIHYIENYN